jgi:hypothetical protein
LIALWWGRRRTVETAALVGAVTALVGFEIVTLLTAIETAATETGVNAAVWLVFGLVYATMVALVGAFCGLAGGTLARPSSIIRSLHH